MKAILFSIKPEYVEKILNGTKKFEYRKARTNENISRVYLYATSPIMKVVACADIVKRLSGNPKELWEQTKLMSGIKRKDFFAYYARSDIGYAYKLDNIKEFNHPKSLSEFGIESPPQSFRYIDLPDS